MNRLHRLLSVMPFLCMVAISMPAAAADMIFQLTNDTERAMSLKLFSHGESHQVWPSRTKSYTLRPDPSVQQLKISCQAGEEICWGAWMAVDNVSGEVDKDGKRNTRTSKYIAGAGERGVTACADCCHVCKDGALLPNAKMSDSAYTNDK